MSKAGPVDLTLVLSPDEMEVLYLAAPGVHYTLSQIVQWCACQAAAYTAVNQGRLDEASMLFDAANRTRHSQWVEMSRATRP